MWSTKTYLVNIFKSLILIAIIVCATYLALKIYSIPDAVLRTAPVIEYYVSDASIIEHLSDAGVDAGPEKVRPTPQQLVKEFLLSELLDLEKQATNPEDKELIRKAIEIKRQKIKEAELSNDFEKNMQKALE